MDGQQKEMLLIHGLFCFLYGIAAGQTKGCLVVVAEETRVRKDECIRSGHRSGRQKKGAWRSLLRKTGCEKMNVSVPATGRVDKERVLAAIAEENRVRKGERIRSGYRSGR